MTMANRQIDADHNIDHCKYPTLYNQLPHQPPLYSSLDSTIGSRKLESLSMTSLGAKVADTGTCQEHVNLAGKWFDNILQNSSNHFEVQKRTKYTKWSKENLVMDSRAITILLLEVVKGLADVSGTLYQMNIMEGERTF